MMRVAECGKICTVNVSMETRYKFVSLFVPWGWGGGHLPPKSAGRLSTGWKIYINV